MNESIGSLYQNMLTIQLRYWEIGGAGNHHCSIKLTSRRIYRYKLSVINQRKNLPIRPPAKLFTIPPPKALLANTDAWLNLSHREKATVFVIVRTRAIAVKC